MVGLDWRLLSHLLGGLTLHLQLGGVDAIHALQLDLVELHSFFSEHPADYGGKEDRQHTDGDGRRDDGPPGPPGSDHLPQLRLKEKMKMRSLV